MQMGMQGQMGMNPYGQQGVVQQRVSGFGNPMMSNSASGYGQAQARQNPNMPRQPSGQFGQAQGQMQAQGNPYMQSRPQA